MDSTKPNIVSINKGLLLAVVLCCCGVACTPPAPPAPIAPPKALGPPLPDPMTFFQNQQAALLPADSLSASELAQLQAGDILLRRGYGLISDYIVATLEEPCALTHCGLLVPYQGKLGVLHTASSEHNNGVLIESLADFVRQSQAYSLVACRPQYSPAQRQQALALAQEYYQQAIPFDYRFDDQEAEALYCVELLRDLFLVVFEQDCLPLHYQRGELSLLGFRNFFDSRTFTLLFNHCHNSSAS